MTNITNSTLDSIASKAIKYKFLFGLPDNAKILLVGKCYNALAKDLNHLFRHVIITEEANLLNEYSVGIHMYELVIIDVDQQLSKKTCLVETINFIKNHLKPTGVMLVQAPNKLSIMSLKRTLGRSILGTGFSIYSYKRLFKSAGFKYSQYYIALPSLNEPEEYISRDCRNLELSANSRRLLIWLNMLGLYHYIHDGFLFIVAQNTTNSFTTRVNDLIDNNLVNHGPDISNFKLEKFFFRNRGALLLILSDPDTNKGYVARIATSSTINSLLSRNMEAVNNIHSLTTFSQSTLSKIPKVLSATYKQGAWVYIEEKKRGTTAWKLESDIALDKLFYQGAFRFIYNFNLEAAEKKKVTDDVFEHILGKDLALIENSFTSQPLPDFRRIRDLFYSYFYGKEIFIVLGHGDYGSGNILCNENTAEILAVIDWDTYIETELPSVDLINLILQRYRKPPSVPLDSAVSKLMNQVTKKGTLDEALDGYNNDDFGLSQKDLIVYLCVAVIRYIKRSLPYKKELNNLSEEYLRAISKVLVILENQF